VLHQFSVFPIASRIGMVPISGLDFRHPRLRSPQGIHHIQIGNTQLGADLGLVKAQELGALVLILVGDRTPAATESGVGGWFPSEFPGCNR